MSPLFPTGISIEMKWWLTAEPKDQDLLVTGGLQCKTETGSLDGHKIPT